ncbi:hypothetical protein [Thiohalomonas denitrificans]|uniref:Uncharacterized protein n=1 Tax=Thiohalomonas denitrificans TaxID=415747 RepID=A0A1G5PZQ2_9GAMM|nr:hypothetical protein [Thiohalomonas denitrificans]SCZ54907.1 hypothetical protein SAMN03097708_01044 [Thiohalomonas denitrificans]
MAIQVIPILKALGPVITTAGSLYAEWQKGREPGAGATERPSGTASERLLRLEALNAENANLIAQLGEQLRAVALQVEKAERAAEVERARLGWLVNIALGVALVAIAMALWVLFAG